MVNKKILITGAAGFIGYHLYNKLLNQGNDVIGLDNFDYPCGAEIDCIKGDVLYPRMVDELVSNVDEIYHLAAQTGVGRSFNESQLTFDVNVDGTENILRSCKKHRKKLVFPSTSEVYGTSQTEFISEDHPLDPQSPYGESKKEAERLCIKYANDGAEVIILRNFNTYGPFQNDDRYGAVIPIFAKRILKGEPPEIFGNGTQTRDLMYITDALHAYEIASKNTPIGKPINFGTGRETSINDLSKILLNLLDSELKAVHIKSRPKEVMRLRADISKARSLGFNPKINIKDGLKMYLDWLRIR